MNDLNIAIPEEEITNSSLKKQLYLILFDMYQSAQIMASAPFNIVRHIVNAKK